jgi:hypothetical protein
MIERGNHNMPFHLREVGANREMQAGRFAKGGAEDARI